MSEHYFLKEEDTSLFPVENPKLYGGRTNSSQFFDFKTDINDLDIAVLEEVICLESESPSYQPQYYFPTNLNSSVGPDTFVREVVSSFENLDTVICQQSCAHEVIKMEVDLPNESTDSITEDQDYSMPLSAGLRQLMTGIVQVQRNDEPLDLVNFSQQQQNAWKIVQETDVKTGTVLEYASNQPMEEQVIETEMKTSTQPMEEPVNETEMEMPKQPMEKQVIETEMGILKQPLFGILSRRLEEHYYQPYQSQPVDLSTALHTGHQINFISPPLRSDDHSLNSTFNYKSPASTASIVAGPSSSEDSMPQLDNWSPPKVKNPDIIPKNDNVQSTEDSTSDADGTLHFIYKSSPERKFVPVPAASISAVSACSTSPPILSSPDQKIQGSSTRKEYFKQDVNSELIGPFSTAIGLKVRHLAFADSPHDGLKLPNEKLTNGLVFELDNYLRNSSFFEGKPRSHLFRIIALHFSYQGIKYEQAITQKDFEKRVLEPMLAKRLEMQPNLPRRSTRNKKAQSPEDELILFDSQVFEIPPRFLEGRHEMVTRRKLSFSSTASSTPTETGSRGRKTALASSTPRKTTAQQLIEAQQKIKILEKQQRTQTRRHEFLLRSCRILQQRVDRMSKYLGLRSFRR